MIIFMVIVIMNMNIEKKYLINKTIDENEIIDENISLLVKNYMEEIIENVRVVKNSNEFSEFSKNSNDETYEEVVKMFTRIMSNKQYYDQIRFIDSNGNEKIRVENNNDDKVEIIPSSQLQNKKDRYYFKNTIKISDDEIYISPLDLNVENGKIEEPYVPMIRFSTPIKGDDNETKGMLIINYRANEFLDLFKTYSINREIENVKFYLLNKNGEFIIHDNEENNFSFMFEDPMERDFLDINEDWWEIICEGFHGHIIDKNNLITYYDLLNKSKESGIQYDEKWVSVHLLDTSKVVSLSGFISKILQPRNLTILLLTNLFSLIFANITEKLRRRDNQLEITEMIAESTNDSVIITDSDTNIIYVNKAYEEATGYLLHEVVGSKPSRFKSGKQSPEFYRDMWKDINDKGIWEGFLWDRKKDGLLYPKKLKIIAVKEKNSRNVHSYIGIFSNLSSTKRINDTFEKLNYRNGEYLLPNEDMMIKLISQSIADNEFSFMVLYIALENYNQLVSSINDEEFKISEIFIELLKPLIHEDDFVAQTGRNLFSVILNMKHIDEQPDVFIKKIHKKLSTVKKIGEQNIFFKTRIGVSFWPNDAADVKNLLLNSIIALEWTVNRQDSEIAFYSKKMIEQLNYENDMESHLRKALEKNELFLMYQPQIDIVNDKIIGIEALVRWNCPEVGMVSPAVFIPIAEKSNLMIEIGNWVIEQVCIDIKQIDNLIENSFDNFRCAINMSVIQIRQPNYENEFFNIIEKHGVDFKRLEVELTESLFISDEMKNIDILNSIRNKGVEIALDDFGTGYSSLSYINKLPIDKIKIDRSFIKDYPENDDGKLAKLLVNMADTLGINVLFEGAETLDQVDYLKEIGCGYVQGYYYSKPLTMEELKKFMMQNKKLLQL